VVGRSQGGSLGGRGRSGHMYVVTRTHTTRTDLTQVQRPALHAPPPRRSLSLSLARLPVDADAHDTSSEALTQPESLAHCALTQPLRSRTLSTGTTHELGSRAASHTLRRRLPLRYAQICTSAPLPLLRCLRLSPSSSRRSVLPAPHIVKRDAPLLHPATHARMYACTRRVGECCVSYACQDTGLDAS
jgi:hypothetical protein